MTVHGACLLIVALAACGGGIAQAPAPSAAPAQATAPSVAVAPSGSAAPAVTQPFDAGAGDAAPVPAAPVAVEMKPIAPSAMADGLRELGLDPKNLPRIEKLEPRTLRGVMKLFAKSLGARCGDCHEDGDFAAPTRRKRIATHMWDEFAVKLTMADASPLFCDSCHQGRIIQLDRRDKKALGKWMDENFVAKLVRKDGTSEECESCHVDMDMHFLTQWAAR